MKKISCLFFIFLFPIACSFQLLSAPQQGGGVPPPSFTKEQTKINDASSAKSEASHQFGETSQGAPLPSPAQFYSDALEEEAHGHLADASLALRRALILDPQFPEAQRKLNELLAQLGVVDEPTWKNQLLLFVSPDLLVISGSSLAWIAAFLILWFCFQYLLHKERKFEKKEKIRLFTLFFMGIVGIGVLTLGTIIDPRTQADHLAVVLPPYDLNNNDHEPQDRPKSVPLRANPLENGTMIVQIPTGSLLSLKSHHGFWSYVQMPSGQKGWITSSALQSICCLNNK